MQYKIGLIGSHGGSLLKILRFKDFKGAQTGGSPEKFQFFCLNPLYKKSKCFGGRLSTYMSAISDFPRGGRVKGSRQN